MNWLELRDVIGVLLATFVVVGCVVYGVIIYDCVKAVWED